MRDFLSIAGKAIVVACGVAFLVFILAFVGPLVIGGPGAHQAPLAAFFYAPGVFFLAFVITLVVQIRKALRLNIGGKIAYFVVLALFLVPTVNIVGIVSGVDPVTWVRNADFKAYSKSERLKYIPPLTEEERRLLQTTHFSIRIGVVNPKFPAVYTRSLVDDLKKTGLFDDVAALDQMEKVDLITTLKGTYYGDKQGQSFTLQPPDGPGKEVSIKVFYILGGLLANGEQQQYLDRISVALIDTVPELLGRDPGDVGRRDGGYTGHGTFVWANGDRYEGAFVDGKRTGRGTFVRKNGTRYVGDFVDNMITGTGTMTSPNGTRYEGEFVNSRRSGQGTMTSVAGSRYEGAWQNGRPHGFGTMTDASGAAFTGTWNNGCFWQDDTPIGFTTSAAKCERE